MPKEDLIIENMTMIIVVLCVPFRPGTKPHQVRDRHTW